MKQNTSLKKISLLLLILGGLALVISVINCIGLLKLQLQLFSSHWIVNILLLLWAACCLGAGVVGLRAKKQIKGVWVWGAAAAALCIASNIGMLTMGAGLMTILSMLGGIAICGLYILQGVQLRKING